MINWDSLDPRFGGRCIHVLLLVLLPLLPWSTRIITTQVSTHIPIYPASSRLLAPLAQLPDDPASDVDPLATFA
ncbi:hypothetical protein CC85DRAFT_281996 [Cutaneotrichosporon oleaginosum]|uniref:Uncharacterized protein n=1 Tax=Cutaneotrichosporon oleaginosum TaxID=879819 RepID=A0A0J1BCR1_9TREE|nr:uncharacterized protein CC85DRAFT_281996 [Cutaneotrichosporon oleaginosum]KLT45844.1 hypothetical protein CC85DRAFT_281996 [Cutaneotrichosporon oleaginosum]TXT06548.1 hypothetical protein COLE_05879 [Cutaneotrichosporon oleaginosum]